jgi:hypothetical protein
MRRLAGANNREWALIYNSYVVFKIFQLYIEIFYVWKTKKTRKKCCKNC